VSGRTLGRRSARASLVLLLLVSAAVAAAAEPAGPAEVTVPLPDGTVLYLRYGEPGGVKIESTTHTRSWSGPAGAAPADSAGLAASSWPETSSLDVLRAMIREELAALRGAASLPVSPQPEVGAEKGARRSEGVSYRLPSSRGYEAAPSRAVVGRGAGSPTAVPFSAAARSPASRDSLVAALQEVRPEVIREQLLDTGVFRTSLILFATDRAELVPRSREIIAIVGGVLQDRPDLGLRVEGHADHRGPEAYNLDLSLRRAQAVADELVRCCAIPSDRILVEGFGESMPLVDGNTPTDLALNRRVEFRILNLDAGP